LNEVSQTGQLYFRPVLCFAPPLSIPKPTNGQTAETSLSGAGTLPSCGSTYATTLANLYVTPNNSVQGYSINDSLADDPEFADYTNTPTVVAYYPNRDVLLPGIANRAAAAADTGRWVLGPEELTGHAIGSARATKDQAGDWVVDYNLTRTGSPLWDHVAQENFHQYLAVELDGVVQSAPLIQPTQSSFTSFDGEGEISGGNMTEANAKELALAMQAGALPVRLRLLTTES
jgi:hypothetical protein